MSCSNLVILNHLLNNRSGRANISRTTIFIRRQNRNRPIFLPHCAVLRRHLVRLSSAVDFDHRNFVSSNFRYVLLSRPVASVLFVVLSKIISKKNAACFVCIGTKGNVAWCAVLWFYKQDSRMIILKFE